MTQQQQLEALMEAWNLIHVAVLELSCGYPAAIFRIAKNAEIYLDQQISDLLEREY